MSQSKIFGIGLSRTGTTSLTLALEILEFSVIHFPMSEEDIEAHDAATDTPIAANFISLDARFPGSKFIYTLRDRVGWLNSCRKFWIKRKESHFDKTPFISELHRRIYGGVEFEPNRFAEAYQRHDVHVRRHFAKRSDDLLIMDICGSDVGWETLCPFLGVKKPQVPFPSVNSSNSVDKVLVRLMHAIEDAKQISAISGISQQYVEDLRNSRAFSDHNPKEPLNSDVGWEYSFILARACSYFGDVKKAAEKLNLSKAWLDEMLARHRRL